MPARARAASVGRRGGRASARPSPSPGLTVGRLLEVDVGVAQRAAGGHVAAHADGQDGAGGRELLVQHGLGHVGVQVAHVERGERVARAAGVHGVHRGAAAGLSSRAQPLPLARAAPRPAPRPTWDPSALQEPQLGPLGPRLRRRGVPSTRPGVGLRGRGSEPARDLF